MGVDTRAILRNGTTIEQIERAISEKYAEVKIHSASHSPNFMWVNFEDGEDSRSMAVSFTNTCEIDDGITGVWISLGMWGKSVEIAKYLCETFGGYLDENDCDENGYYPINFHLYSQGNEFTKLDEFRHKVISELGYDKLKKAMQLLEEYKSI